MVNRGEVWWYDHPVAGRRPYLVLTRDEALPVLNRVLGVPATSTVRRIATEVELDHTDGMPMDCALTLDNLEPIRPALCAERITKLGPERMAKVCEALGAATGCRLTLGQ